MECVFELITKIEVRNYVTNINKKTAYYK